MLGKKTTSKELGNKQNSEIKSGTTNILVSMMQRYRGK